MKIIKPSYSIMMPISGGGIKELQRIEQAARTCYKSEDKIDKFGESAEKMVKMLIDRGHEAMLEHSQLSVRFVCDRGVSHELVRHRIASFAQQSTRYCNYSQDKFGNELTFIEPCFYDEIPDETKSAIKELFMDDSERVAGSSSFTNPSDLDWRYARWIVACKNSEEIYLDLINRGATPQEARSVLNNSLKTEIVVTANYREWRQILKLRCAEDAHPQMRELMIPLCLELQSRIPIVFDDCYKPKDTGGWSLEVTPG